MVKYVLLLLFAGTAISHAVTLCDFTPQGTTAGGDTPNPSAVINRDRAPEQRATYENGGLQLRWNTDLQSSFLVGEPWANTVPLKQFKQANCYIELEIPERSPLSNIYVKFIDSKQEIFQWGIVVDSREPGSCRLSIPMTPHNFQLAYRGNNDKKIDFPIRFYSFSATARKNSGEASILIKKIEYESTSPDSMWNLISFDLETGNTAHVLRKGEESKLKLLLHNSGSTPLPCRATIEFRDFFHHTITEKAVITIPENGTLQYSPKTRLPRLGYWTVHLRLEALDGTGFTEQTRSLAYMVPAGPGKLYKKGFLFGICIPGWYDEKIFSREAETAALCGASALRLNFRWRELERQPDSWHLTLLNRIIDEYEKRGMEVMPILSNPPVWARKNTPNSMPKLDEWRKYVSFFFKKYGDKIRYWEIWNEPDLTSFCEFSAPEYIELLKTAREEQKKWAPKANLLTGGFAHAYPDNNKNGFQEYVLAHGKEYFDIHAFHGHGDFKSFRRHVEQFLLSMRKRNGVTAPWYANETAVTACGIGEKKQAETLFKKFLFSWSAGAIGYNWYNLRNNGFLANNPEHNYGLVTFDFYPKPAYVVYNTLATFFRNKEFIRRHTQGNAIWILEFAGGGDRAVALWNELPENVPDEIAAFRSDARSVDVVDLMGNIRSLQTEETLAEIQIRQEPVILLFRECSNLRYLGSSAKGWITGGAVPGIPALWNLSLFNPSSGKRSIHLKLNHGQGIQTSHLPAELLLNPGERKRVSAEINVTSAKSNQDNALDLNLGVSSRQYKLHFPMRWTVFIPQEKKENQWDFHLCNREQVHSLFDADPGNLHRLWSGPEDLSAKIRMHVKNGIWTLQFNVTDDKHIQPFRGVNVWQGDNIQLAFKVSGQSSLWTAGLTLRADGKPELFLWDLPAKFNRGQVLQAWKLDIRRAGTLTNYEVKIPLSSIGVDAARLKQGIRFNALINDNDGYGREGWIQITEGIAGTRSSEPYPLLIFETE